MLEAILADGIVLACQTTSDTTSSERDFVLAGGVLLCTAVERQCTRGVCCLSRGILHWRVHK